MHKTGKPFKQKRTRLMKVSITINQGTYKLWQARLQKSDGLTLNKNALQAMTAA